MRPAVGFAQACERARPVGWRVWGVPTCGQFLSGGWITDSWWKEGYLLFQGWWNTLKHYLPLQFTGQHHELYVLLAKGNCTDMLRFVILHRAVASYHPSFALLKKSRSCLKRQDLVISSPLPSFDRFWCKVQQAMIQQPPYYGMAMDTFRRDGVCLHLWWLVPSISFGSCRGMVLRCGCWQCSLAKLGSTLRMKIYIQLERLHVNFQRKLRLQLKGNYGSNWKVRICGFDQIVFFFL